VTVTLSADGTADLDALNQYASSMRDSVITNTELLTYMNKSVKHTSVILAMLAAEYVVVNERPVVSKAVATALSSKIAGTLLNHVQFNPNSQPERLQTLRSGTVAVCTANNLLIPGGSAGDDPLLLALDKAITDAMLLDREEKKNKVSLTRDELEARRREFAEKRKMAHEKNDEYIKALKELTPFEQRMNECKIQSVMWHALLSQVSIQYVLPFLPEWTGNMACFVINGVGDPFFLDKKGTGDFYSKRLFAAMIKTGSLVPVDANGVPAICLLSFGHWFIERTRNLRNALAESAEQVVEFNQEIQDFQESLFYNSGKDGKSPAAMFRALFPDEAPPTAEWFTLKENPVWRRDAGEYPDRSKPRPKQSGAGRTKRKLEDDKQP